MTQGESPPSGINGVTWDCIGDSRERFKNPFSRRIPRNVPLFKCFEIEFELKFELEVEVDDDDSGKA